MNTGFVKSGIVLSTMALFLGCGSSGSGSGSNTTQSASGLPQVVQQAISAPTSSLSQELTNTLSYMGNEERLAYDVYNYLYEEFGTIQFTNIATNSEYKHITAVQALVQKYNLDDSTCIYKCRLATTGL